MPELPEVETIKRSLEKKLPGKTITGVTVYLPKVTGFRAPEQFEHQIIGKRIVTLARRGKYLLIHLSDNKTLIIHLRMTGRLVYTLPPPPEKHTHVVFNLNDGHELHFNDIRRFGKILLEDSNNLDTVPGFKDLGIEPLSDSFDKGLFRRELRRRRAKIKSLLLDQTFLAGLGNIYVDEALHRARINPQRITASLSPREVTNLYNAIRKVLMEGIENRGTSFRDYVDGDGRAGNYQELLRVYNREGQPCKNCATGIIRMKLAGRSTYFCPRCQKAK